LAEVDRKATRDKARNGSGKQPISRHPLFPATVAIWFGALFGLGSLAIRPALLESAVLATHIDAVVAAAAPPLGITARILLALAMAGLGGLIGATIARKISLPSQPKAERKRGAMGVLGRKAPEPAPRRRPLAIDESNLHQDHREHAPLPGGAPQILNVNDYAFDEPEAPAMSHFPTPAAPPVAAAAPDALDLAAFDAACDEEPVRPQYQAQYQPEYQAQVPTQFEEPAAPVDRWSPPTAPAFEPPAYHPPAFELPAFDAAPLPTPASEPLDLGAASAEAEIASGPEPEPYSPFAARTFDGPPPERPFAAPAAPAEPFAPAVTIPPAPVAEPSSTVIAAWSHDAATAPPLFGEHDEVSDEARAALAGANAPRPFDAPPLGAARSFDPPAASPAAPEPEPVMAEPVAYTPEQVTAPVAFMPEPEPAPEPQAIAPAEPEVAPVAMSTQNPEAVARIAEAQLGALSQAELLERLAMSLQRRRAQAGTVVPAAPPSPATPPAPMPFAAPETPVAAAAPPMPVEYAAPQATPVAPVEQLRPIAQLAPEPQTEPAPRTVASIPAALRPVAFDDADLDDSLPGFVPPRSIALPVEPVQPAAVPASFAPPAETAAPAPFAAPVPTEFAPAPVEAVEAEEEPEDDSLALEDGYSSLLSLSLPGGPRQQFVRIEEPEPAGDEIEPVVIFPGQHAAGAPLAAVPPAPAPELPVASTPAGPRPFDAPDMATVAARPVQQDPEETERALRAALASLQRMSGAA